MLLPLLALSPLALPQTTWFVDDDATPPGTGTAQDPYASIQFAIDAPTTVDGDEVRVLSGDYPEDVLIDSKVIDLRGDTSAGPVRVVKASAATRSLTIRSVAAPGVHVAGIEFAQDDVSLEGGGVLVESSVVVLSLIHI